MMSPSSVKPSSSRILRMVASSMSVPSRALIFSGSSFRVVSCRALGTTSMTPSTTSPQPSSSISSQARSTAL